MAGGQEGESPRRGELTSQGNNQSKEQGGIHKEVAANSPLAPGMEEQQGWYEMPHEKLVRAFQDYVQQHPFRGFWSPKKIIRERLNLEAHSTHLLSTASPEEKKKEKDFFYPLLLAWDILAYDRYEAGLNEEHLAAVGLSSYYQHYRVISPDRNIVAIKLSHPVQIGVLDALTEAVGIPHQKRQAEIETPEKLRDWNKWTMSKEYQERWAKAKSKK
jgi:hypothetical protein